MPRRFLTLCVVGSLLSAAPVWAQEPPAGPWAGNWRGTATLPNGETAVVVLTIIKQNTGYTGFVSGFGQGTEVPLVRVTVEGEHLVVEARADSDLGRVRVRYELGREEGRTLSGLQRYVLGTQTAEFPVELRRTRRRDVPQPQVEQRISYFEGEWELEYTGGEYPPLSLGTRTAQVTFTPQGDAPFLTGQVTGAVYGDAYEESLMIGWDERSHVLVMRETLSTGVELLSVGNWQSPIAINFVTSPVEADGQVLQMRRVISVTSETAFMLTEEFSVDGGPFRRLGNGHFTRVR